ncbi:MAG: hypothetical protein ACKO21_13940 [Nodosilinea sp.]
MASSSRSLRSQTLNRLLAAYRRVRQRLTAAGRWSRTTLVWATQVVIYPLYLVLQSGRRLGQWFPSSGLGQTLRTGWRGPVPALPRDAPILACLLSIPGPGQDGLVSPGPLDRSLSRFVHRSGVRSALVPASWMDRVWPTPLQGVACDLASSQLVLVAATNQVVSDLTADQRHQLEQAIWLLLAEYGHHQHRPALAASPSLPPPPIRPVLRPQGGGPALALPRDGPILALQLSLPSLGEAALVNPSPLDRGFTRFVHRSGVRATLVPASWMDQAWPAPFQGVACDLASGQLVLVLATNQVVSDLTADQRHQLEQAIWLLLAEYGHHQHRPTLATPKSLLRPPIHPGRWLGAALTWMQTSPLAIVTNLFGEADRLSPSLPMVALGSSPTAPSLVPGPQTPPRGQAAVPATLPEVTALEAEATLLHYVDHPLMILLRLLDSLLHGLETWLRSLWAWLSLRF